MAIREQRESLGHRGGATLKTMETSYKRVPQDHQAKEEFLEKQDHVVLLVIQDHPDPVVFLDLWDLPVQLEILVFLVRLAEKVTRGAMERLAQRDHKGLAGLLVHLEGLDFMA